MRWRTINIFIPDSNPRSVKICDIKDSIVKAIFIPRSRLEKVSNRSDLTSPGIYFLFGKENEIGKPIVYIGEAENLLVRIKQHNAKKDFRNTAICFVSEKNNINKAHIKYLENYCCNQAIEINKCKLENSTTPTQSSLTEQDIDFVLNFFDDLKILITTLWYPIFEETKKEEKNILICKGKDAYAEGKYWEDGLVVFAWAHANLNESKSSKKWGQWMLNIRNMLIKSNIMEVKNNIYLFKEDYSFSSPSAAASVILGRNANWWTEWKDKNGKSIDEIYRQK